MLLCWKYSHSTPYIQSFVPGPNILNKLLPPNKQPLHFYMIFSDVHIWSVIISAIIMNYIFIDGKSNYFQGNERPPNPDLLLGGTL